VQQEDQITSNQIKPETGGALENQEIDLGLRHLTTQSRNDIDALTLVRRVFQAGTPLFMYLPFQVTHSPYEIPVRKRSFLAIYIYKRSFYQDRLGTNIGKTQKRDRCSTGR
jgi:hypothetical protein